MADPLVSRIEAILTGDLHVAEEKIRPEANLRHDLGLDSFAAVELAFALEEQFAIKVADEEIATVKTFGELVAAVRKKLEGGAAG